MFVKTIYKSSALTSHTVCSWVVLRGAAYSVAITLLLWSCNYD